MTNLIYIATFILAVIASYKVGRFKGKVESYHKGWDDCIEYHDWQTSLEQAAQTLKSKGYMKCGLRKERRN